MKRRGAIRGKARGASANRPIDPPPQPLQVSSSHLARSYHHLFPVPPYKEVPANESPELDACHGCQRRLDVASSKVSELKWIG